MDIPFIKQEMGNPAKYWASKLLLLSLCVSLMDFSKANPIIGSSPLATAPLVDLQADKRITLCTGEKRPLSCHGPSSAIALTGVFWGRTSPDICPSEDGDPITNCENLEETRDIVKKICEGMGSCMLEAKKGLLQTNQHCFGVNKYLQVNYTCVPADKEALLCNTERTILVCPSDWRMKINSAFWGRETPDVCPSPMGKDICKGAEDTLSKLREKCDNNEYCPLQANVEDLQNGEICPRVDKYLIVNYSCLPSKDVRRREQVGRLPLSLFKSLIRSKIPHPDGHYTRSEIPSGETRHRRHHKHNKHKKHHKKNH